MKDHEREFLASCDLDPDIDNDERARSLAVYRKSGPWQRAEVGLALDALRDHLMATWLVQRVMLPIVEALNNALLAAGRFYRRTCAPPRDPRG